VTMAGRLYDLDSGASLPQEFLIDTNLLVTQFIPNNLVPSDTMRRARAANVFAKVMTGVVQAYASPRSVEELFHVYLRAWYEHELKVGRAKYQGALVDRFGPRKAAKANWMHLLKIRPSYVRAVTNDLSTINHAITATNVSVLQRDGFTFGPETSSWEEMLIRIMRRYKMDTADASILIDARMAEINSVVTLDKDFNRALKDFDVYTWL
jgi:predicted nucleic acid-binding protein